MPQNGKVGLAHLYAGPKRWMLNSKVYRKIAKAEVDTPYKWLLLFSRSVVSDSLQPHGLQHTSLPVLQYLPVWSNSHPLSQRWHLIISSSVHPFSSCLQSFPASGFFSSESVLSMRPKYGSFSFNISPSKVYSGLICFRIDWLISLLSKELSSIFFSAAV